MRPERRRRGAAKARALDLLARGRLEEARAVLSELCRKGAGDAEAWFHLAGLHAHAGRLREAAECLGRSVALEPGVAAAHCNLATVYPDFDSAWIQGGDFR